MLGKLLDEAARFLAGIRHHRIGPIAAVRRYLHLYRRRRFSPNEIHFLNLLDPALSTEGLDAFVSKEELLEVQRSLNRLGNAALTEDKLAFAAHCLARGLPTPEIHAVYDTGEHAHGALRVLRDARALDAFLDSLNSGDVIVKPIDGVHGEGVMRLWRDGGSWKLGDGREASAAALLDAFSAAGYRRWMFQQRIVGNAELRALSNADGLQTVRVVTLVDAAGDVQVLAGRLRLICNDGAQDNFDFGRTGNLVANLDLESGRIRNVVGSHPERLSMRSVERHPRSGRELIGYPLPHWQAVKALAVAAADAFRPLRTIGWDVAVTDGPPLLIEGNVTWDTLIGEPRMGVIHAELRRLAEALAARAPHA